MEASSLYCVFQRVQRRSKDLNAAGRQGTVRRGRAMARNSISWAGGACSQPRGHAKQRPARHRHYCGRVRTGGRADGASWASCNVPGRLIHAQRGKSAVSALARHRRYASLVTPPTDTPVSPGHTSGWTHCAPYGPRGLGRTGPDTGQGVTASNPQNSDKTT